jgi:hypothetical protein
MVVVMLLATRRQVMGAFRLPPRLGVLDWSATGVMMVAASALCALVALQLLLGESRGRRVGAANEQPIGTAYQEMGVLEGLENQPAGMPFQTRQLRRLADGQLGAGFFEKYPSQSCDAVADSRNSAHPALLCLLSRSQ